ncbi:hypothetical protein [Nonomuraea sp. NPDC050202]|uniref:hypothetical protein n=1 Tax=Nonomuraea sp. NPDC050202 TaxID=3155035 RepID=UPI0033F2FD68
MSVPARRVPPAIGFLRVSGSAIEGRLRLRPPTGSTWWRLQRGPGWEPAAAPPQSDAFVACWAWQVARLPGGSHGRPAPAAGGGREDAEPAGGVPGRRLRRAITP